MKTDSEHRHYTTASLAERLLFKEYADSVPGLFQSITYTDVEGDEYYDLIFTLSGETKPRIADIKVRDSNSTWDGYTIEKKKFDALHISAHTYTPTYINFFADGKRFFMWDLTHPDNQPAFQTKLHQHNNINNQMTEKKAADLFVTAATQYIYTYSTTKTKEKANNIYQLRLNKGKWKKRKLK